MSPGSLAVAPSHAPYPHEFRCTGGFQMSVNRIDPTPLRISNNLTIQRQTPKTDFGDRMKAGLDTAMGVVANGAGVVGGLIPGGAIVSAAVSSVGAMTAPATPSGGGAMAASYGASGVTALGGGTATTLGGTPGSTGGAPGGFGGVNMGSTVGSSNYVPGAGSSAVGDMNQQLIQSQSENAQMM